MNNYIKISCLPVAGIENPYQYLMIEGLKSDKRLKVNNGIHDKFFGIPRTAHIQRPNYIHFDWETSYYYRRNLWMTLLNVPLFILQVYLAKWIYKCELVWTPHNIIPHDAKHIRLHRFCRRVFAKQMKWIRLFSSLSIEKAMSEFQCHSKKFIIIPEGSYVSYYKNTISKSDARYQLGIKNETRLILYLGYIKPYKGITDLIKCFNKYNFQNTKLLIAGRVIDKNYYLRIKNFQTNKLEIIDSYISEDDLQVYFNAADIVALPFKQIENSGSVIMAMGFKKAIIAPKKGVIIDRLKNQLTLLYENSLDEVFDQLNNLTEFELDKIGEMNYYSLNESSWADFSKAF